VFPEKSVGIEKKTGSTETALEPALFYKSILQRSFLQSFNCDDVLTLSFNSEHQTGFHGEVVCQYGTCAAVPVFTSPFTLRSIIVKSLFKWANPIFHFGIIF
jgi:hypothetical protein